MKMNEQIALLKFIGIIITVAVWGYANFSKHPEIVKNRDTTQKWMNTIVALVFLYFIVTGID
jgi:hypothetical protein